MWRPFLSSIWQPNKTSKKRKLCIKVPVKKKKRSLITQIITYLEVLFNFLNMSLSNNYFSWSAAFWSHYNCCWRCCFSSVTFKNANGLHHFGNVWWFIIWWARAYWEFCFCSAVLLCHIVWVCTLVLSLFIYLLLTCITIEVFT